MNELICLEDMYRTDAIKSRIAYINCYEYYLNNGNENHYYSVSIHKYGCKKTIYRHYKKYLPKQLMPKFVKQRLMKYDEQHYAVVIDWLGDCDSICSGFRLNANNDIIIKFVFRNSKVPAFFIDAIPTEIREKYLGIKRKRGILI